MFRAQEFKIQSFWPQQVGVPAIRVPQLGVWGVSGLEEACEALSVLSWEICRYEFRDMSFLV